MSDVASAKPLRAELPCTVEIGRYRLALWEAGKRPARVWEEYTQERLLGEGGFGKVYAARRNEDLWPVAIKEIDLADDPELRERNRQLKERMVRAREKRREREEDR